MTQPLTKHPFKPGRWRDPYGRQICAECDCIKDHRLHKLPERTEDEREAEARRVGEHE